MKVELFLNPEAPEYIDFLDDLKEELSELKGLKYSEETVPAPPKTLTVEHEVVRLVFEHGGQAISLVTALLQLIRAALERRRRQESSKQEAKIEPLGMLSAGDRQLKYPATPQAERRFLEGLKKRKNSKKASNRKHAPRKSKR